MKNIPSKPKKTKPKWLLGWNTAAPEAFGISLLSYQVQQCQKIPTSLTLHKWLFVQAQCTSCDTGYCCWDIWSTGKGEWQREGNWVLQSFQMSKNFMNSADFTVYFFQSVWNNVHNLMYQTAGYFDAAELDPNFIFKSVRWSSCLQWELGALAVAQAEGLAFWDSCGAFRELSSSVTVPQLGIATNPLVMLDIVRIAGLGQRGHQRSNPCHGQGPFSGPGTLQ